MRHLNLLLSRDGSFSPETTVKTFTANVSRHGTFIHSMEEWKLGDKVWLRYNPVDPEPPIVGEVCWTISWGQADCIPGIGVKFLDITERQRNQVMGCEV